MKYLRDLSGKILKFKGGRRVKLEDYDQDPSDKAVKAAQDRTIAQRIADIELVGAEVPQHLKDAARALTGEVGDDIV